MNRHVIHLLAAVATVVLALPLGNVPAYADPGGPPRGDSPAGAAREHAKPVAGAVPVRSPNKSRVGTFGTAATLAACATSKYLDASYGVVFRVDTGCDLDQYLYRASSPLDFSITVDRYGGPVTAEGYPAPGNIFLHSKAMVTLRAWDVDESSGEVDQLLVNGHPIPPPSGGLLSGANDQFSTITFDIDASMLKFPASSSEVGVNDFQVLIDTTADGWAVEIDWAELRLFNDALPVAMIHGILGNEESMKDVKDYYEQQLPDLTGKIITPAVTHHGSIEDNELLMRQPIADLLESTGAAQLNLVAHSMGGLDSRRYAFLNPGKVRNVVMIGTPNGGSPVADLLCALKNNPEYFKGTPDEIRRILIWFGREFGECDGPQNGLYQLRMLYVTTIFNKAIRDAGTGANYFTIGGNGVGPTSVFVQGPSDGVVPVGSLRWLDANGPNDGVHQSLDPIFPLNHSELIEKGSGALGLSLCNAYPEKYSCLDYGGLARTTAPLAAGDPFQLSDVGTAEIPPAGSVDIPLGVESATAAQVTILTQPGVTGTYNGVPLQQGELLGKPVLCLTTTGGAGTVRLNNPTGAQATAIAFATVQTARKLTVAAPPGLATAGSAVTAAVNLSEATAGEPVEFEVKASDGGVVASGSASATGTGSYTLSFVPAVAGTYSITAWTSGARSRSAGTVVPVGANDGRAIGTGANWLTSDVNGDGRYDALEVSVPVQAPTGGRFVVTGDLIGPGGHVITSAGGTVDITSGSGWATLRFPGETIFESGLDGPYTLGNLVLSDADTNLLDEASTQSVSAGYVATQFDHLEVDVDLSSFTHHQVDADGNRYAEKLLVTGDVRVDRGGTYAINARLVGPAGQQITEHQQTATLAAGHNTVTLDFAWPSIAAGGIDGPYTVKDLSTYPTSFGGNGAFLPTAHTTEAYLASGLINRPPVVSAQPVTVEGNTVGGYTGALTGASGQDPDGDTVTLTNNAPTLLPLGLTSLVWTATDQYLAASTTVQSVTVRDTKAPTITCPQMVITTSTTPALGTPVVSDKVDASPTVTNDAPTTFPIARNIVTWTARDQSGNAATCQQTVHVAPPGPYTFTGFFVGSKNVDDVTTCAVGTTAPYHCDITVSWQLKDSAGRVISAPTAVHPYSTWPGKIGPVTFDAATQRFSVRLTANLLELDPVGQFLMLRFVDGSVKPLYVVWQARAA